MEELLALCVLHDSARLVVRLHGHALLVPADRLGFSCSEAITRANVLASWQSSAGGSWYWSVGIREPCQTGARIRSGTGRGAAWLAR